MFAVSERSFGKIVTCSSRYSVEVVLFIVLVTSDASMTKVVIRVNASVTMAISYGECLGKWCCFESYDTSISSNDFYYKHVHDFGVVKQIVVLSRFFK